MKPNGKSIDVTEENKLEYIILLSDFKLNKQIQSAVKNFKEGFNKIINTDWLNMFNHDELQLVISGIKGIDIKDIKHNVNYQGFNQFSSTVQDLWEVLEEMTEEDRALFLLFVTSCSRPPTLGFASLNPRIQIQNTSCAGYYKNAGKDRLPTASTCMNILKLPDYNNKDLLRDKLLLAIRSKSGFNLS